MTTLATLKTAIENKQQISFEYIKEGKKNGTRIWNPYAVYIFTAKSGEQSTKVHIVQTDGVSDSADMTEPLPFGVEWEFRNFNIEDLAKVEILSDRPLFSKPYHSLYKPESEMYKDVIAKV